MYLVSTYTTNNRVYRSLASRSNVPCRHGEFQYSKDWRSSGEIARTSSRLYFSVLRKKSIVLEAWVRQATRRSKDQELSDKRSSLTHTHTHIACTMQIAQQCRSKLFPTSETHYAVTLHVNFHGHFFFFFLDGNGKAESLHPRRGNSITAIDISDDD